MAPTRELALQVKDHLQGVASCSQSIRIVAIVGGMAVQKQERLLDRGADIVVATPGRLFELISGDSLYTKQARAIRHLVIDEVDRMLERGHFKELEQILHIVNGNISAPVTETDDIKPIPVRVTPNAPRNRQIMIFSATLAHLDLKANLNRPDIPSGGKRAVKEKSGSNAMDDLFRKVGFSPTNTPHIIDMTVDRIVAEKVTESRVACSRDDKDHYLYYFLKEFPGRTIVFINAISPIKSIVQWLQHLGLTTYGLHAQMQQRARLKNLDRFRADDKAILIASDVAARGLDLPAVDHVIHYHLPLC